MTRTRNWKIIGTTIITFMGLYIAAMMTGIYELAVTAVLVPTFFLAAYLVAKSDFGQHPAKHKMGE